MKKPRFVTVPGPAAYVQQKKRDRYAQCHAAFRPSRSKREGGLAFAWAWEISPRQPLPPKRPTIPSSLKRRRFPQSLGPLLRPSQRKRMGDPAAADRSGPSWHQPDHPTKLAALCAQAGANTLGTGKCGVCLGPRAARAPEPEKFSLRRARIVAWARTRPPSSNSELLLPSAHALHKASRSPSLNLISIRRHPSKPLLQPTPPQR